MKMKTKVILLIAVLVSFINVNAQTECTDKLSIFVELAKSKNYNDAYPALNELRKSCPSVNAAVYLYGEPTINFKIDNAATKEEKEK